MKIYEFLENHDCNGSCKYCIVSDECDESDLCDDFDNSDHEDGKKVLSLISKSNISRSKFLETEKNYVGEHENLTDPNPFAAAIEAANIAKRTAAYYESVLAGAQESDLGTDIVRETLGKIYRSLLPSSSFTPGDVPRSRKRGPKPCETLPEQQDTDGY